MLDILLDILLDLMLDSSWDEMSNLMLLDMPWAEHLVLLMVS